MKTNILLLLSFILVYDVAHAESKNKYDLCRRTSTTGYGDYAWGEMGTTTTPCRDNYQTPEAWNSEYYSRYSTHPWCFYNAYYTGDNSYYVCCYDLYASGCPSSGSAPPPSCHKYSIETHSWSLKMSTSYLYIWMSKSASSDKYSLVMPFAEDLKRVAGELEQIAKGNSSCSFITQFFLEVVRPAYDRLQRQFELAHSVALDPSVGASWQELDNDYRKLRSVLR